MFKYLLVKTTVNSKEETAGAKWGGRTARQLLSNSDAGVKQEHSMPGQGSPRPPCDGTELMSEGILGPQ